MLNVKVESGTALLTLNDPDRRNILSAALVDRIVDTFDTLEANPAVTAVVITGAGRTFCAGADLGDLLAAADGDASGVKRVYEGFLRVARSPLPTVAAVNGPAVGAGLNLALACDVRIAAASAWFDTRFLKIGLHPGGGHTWMLQRLVGPQTAAAMVLFGERMDGTASVAAGLTYRCVPDAELLDTARALAEGAADVEPELLRRTKQSLGAALGRTHGEAVADETLEQLWSLTLPSTAGRLRDLRDRISGTSNG